MCFDISIVQWPWKIATYWSTLELCLLLRWETNYLGVLPQTAVQSDCCGCSDVASRTVHSLLLQVGKEKTNLGENLAISTAFWKSYRTKTHSHPESDTQCEKRWLKLFLFHLSDQSKGCAYHLSLPENLTSTTATSSSSSPFSLAIVVFKAHEFGIQN